MTGYERVNKDEKFYYVDSASNCNCDHEIGADSDKNKYRTANYYSSSLVAEENARADELMRKLRRFAVENNECELDWEDNQQLKSEIFYDYEENKIYTVTKTYRRSVGCVYFSSNKIAEQAIEEYKDDLIWYFTEYQDHVTEPEKIECEWCGDEKKLQAMKVLGYKMCPYCCKELSE